MIHRISEIIKKVVGGEIEFNISIPDQENFGHYATNAAFMVKQDPKVLADKIKDVGGDLFEKVEVAGKFINFWISPRALLEELGEVLKSKRLINSKTQQLINLEFISANPTGPLTMANGRGGFWGDVLASVLEFTGHKVTREYYVNDAGNQIKLLGESVMAALGLMPSKEEHYQGEYVKDLAQKLADRTSAGAEAEKVGRMAADILLTDIRKSVENVGIKFDVWFSENKNLREGGLIAKVLANLEKAGLVTEHDGAKWLKTSDIADEKDRVLVKSDGNPTYFLADIGYHYDKFIKRKFDTAITIWGADHHGYVARLKAGVKALGVEPGRLKIIIAQLVRLVEGGKEVRLSKRKGEFVTLDELIKEVGKDAARFFFLMHTPESHMDFDLALAKEKSLKNPVYYVQYAYVRMNSILEKSKVQSTKSKINLQILKDLKGESEWRLIRELVKFNDMVLQTAEDYGVSRLARYALDIAKAFHNFYEKERVIDEKGNAAEGKLALVVTTREVLGKLFDLLGIDKVDRM